MGSEMCIRDRPYIYMEGRIRKDGSVLFYVFSASGALKHHEDDWDID